MADTGPRHWVTTLEGTGDLGVLILEMGPSGYHLQAKVGIPVATIHSAPVVCQALPRSVLHHRDPSSPHPPDAIGTTPPPV